MKKYIHVFFHVLAFNLILFFPFEFHLIPFPKFLVNFFFKSPLESVHALIFQHKIQSFEFTSDSSELIALVVLIFTLSILISLLVYYFPKFYNEKTIALVKTLSCYYLSLMLFKYGVYKLFHTQFYVPEPNTLFTPIGLLDKDILYWSTMGVSYQYNVFIGIVEITASIFLLFKMTRVIGLLISLATLVNILAVNHGFNISVKTLTYMLLFLNVLSLSNHIRALVQFLTFKSNISLTKTAVIFENKKQHITLKSFAVLVLLLESFYPQISSMINKEEQKNISAAYELINENDSISKNGIKRLFIHGHHFLIFQYNNDSIQDYKLEIDTLNKLFILQDYTNRQTKLPYLKYNKDSLVLQNYQNQDLRFKYIHSQDLPVFK